MLNHNLVSKIWHKQWENSMCEVIKELHNINHYHYYWERNGLKLTQVHDVCFGNLKKSPRTENKKVTKFTYNFYFTPYKEVCIESTIYFDDPCVQRITRHLY
jgi:hypothetical protein